jgi:hypothetical protein
LMIEKYLRSMSPALCCTLWREMRDVEESATNCAIVL